MINSFRKGPVGALIGEYYKAAGQLKDVIAGISDEDFSTVVDNDVDNHHCMSIKSIMNHVVSSGYAYANYIRKQFGDPLENIKPDYNFNSDSDARRELDKMMIYTEETLINKQDINFDEVLENIIKTRWGQKYDLEQMLEHAIVHILRHRRQIENFLIILSRQ